LHVESACWQEVLFANDKLKQLGSDKCYKIFGVVNTGIFYLPAFEMPSDQ